MQSASILQYVESKYLLGSHAKTKYHDRGQNGHTTEFTDVAKCRYIITRAARRACCLCLAFLFTLVGFADFVRLLVSWLVALSWPLPLHLTNRQQKYKRPCSNELLMIGISKPEPGTGPCIATSRVEIHYAFHFTHIYLNCPCTLQTENKNTAKNCFMLGSACKKSFFPKL